MKLLEGSLILLAVFLSPQPPQNTHLTMYKMYNAQCDEESDDEKSSLNSSFWSDGEREEDDEEEKEIERLIVEEPSKPVEEPPHEISEEEKPAVSVFSMSRESSEGGSGEDDGDEGEDGEEGYSSSLDSPAPSLMTSGYGTYRPEEPEGADYRDEQFDQDSRGDLSEVRDDENDDHSLCSFAGFDNEPREPDNSETHLLSELTDSEPETSVPPCGEDEEWEEVDITHMNGEDKDKDRARDEKFKDGGCKNDATKVTLEKQRHVAVSEDPAMVDDENLEGDTVGEEVQQPSVEKEDAVEFEDLNESSSNNDVKFIDSTVDFTQMTYEKMCEWEGNLRANKGKAFPV